MGFDIYSIYSHMQPRFRRQRWQVFINEFRPNDSTRILDVGGYPFNWVDCGIRSQITVINLPPPHADWKFPDGCVYRQGDGRSLPFDDGSFDIVFSNSVIEHINRREDQLRFASEAMRVGRQIFIQTPNRWFPIEPHFLSPFCHYLPKKWQRPLVRFFSVRGLLRRGDDRDLMELFDELRLLSYRELQELFLGCVIYRERVCGLTKSLIALKKRPSDRLEQSRSSK